MLLTIVREVAFCHSLGLPGILKPPANFPCWTTAQHEQVAGGHHGAVTAAARTLAPGCTLVGVPSLLQHTRAEGQAGLTLRAVLSHTSGMQAFVLSTLVSSFHA